MPPALHINLATILPGIVHKQYVYMGLLKISQNAMFIMNHGGQKMPCVNEKSKVDITANHPLGKFFAGKKREIRM